MVFRPERHWRNRTLRFLETADAVSALIYYIHILGDCLDSEDLKNYKWHIADQMPFARPHPYEGNEDVCYEIGKHLDVLFKKSKSHSYKGTSKNPRVRICQTPFRP